MDNGKTIMNFKFKVGQKVKLKNPEELRKFTNYENWDPKYKQLAGKLFEVFEIRFSFLEYYKLKTKNEVFNAWFREDLLEYPNLNFLVEI